MMILARKCHFPCYFVFCKTVRTNIDISRNMMNRKRKNNMFLSSKQFNIMSTDDNFGAKLPFFVVLRLLQGKSTQTLIRLRNMMNRKEIESGI